MRTLSSPSSQPPDVVPPCGPVADRRPRRHPSRPRVIQGLSLGLFCYLFFYVAWPYSDHFTSTHLPERELLPAETFLYLDPLTSLVPLTAVPCLPPSLAWLAGAVLLCLFVPRWFCSHACPLGTTIDIVDRAIGKRQKKRPPGHGHSWRGARFGVLAATLLAAPLGVSLVGCVGAIPLVSRALLFIVAPAQTAVLKHRGMIPPTQWTYWLSIGLFVCVLLTSLFGRRFWCRFICPSGAAYSLFSLLRLRQRAVLPTCTLCGKCHSACSFDAIRPDFSTRDLACTFCGECQRVCPVDAISYTSRLATPMEQTRTAGSCCTQAERRGFLASVTAGLVGAAGIRFWKKSTPATKPTRPPGSLPEREFLARCIRCGECMKICPGPVLQPAGIEAGLEGMWTPVAKLDWAGCHQDCNLCCDVCPTGAIAPLPIAEKRRAVMGLAVIDHATCLPHAGLQDCQLCYDECRAAGYHAIRMQEIQLEIGDIPDGVMSPLEIEEASRICVPVVNIDACVGCGLCQYRCHTVWHKQKGLLRRGAITVLADLPRRPECRESDARQGMSLERVPHSAYLPSIKSNGLHPHVSIRQLTQ